MRVWLTGLLAAVIWAFGLGMPHGRAADRVAAHRVALVIGNGAYAFAPKLANPANDALAVAKVLGDLGFEVVTGLDLDRRAIRQAFSEFGGKAQGAEVLLIFYAGHAMQVREQNYIVPVDADIGALADLDRTMISLADELSAVWAGNTAAPERATVVLLDACRNNPFADSIARDAPGAVGRGFVPISTGDSAPRSAAGSDGLAALLEGRASKLRHHQDGELAVTRRRESVGFLAAATAGEVALDGSGSNSPFTTVLITELAKPQALSSLFTNVRNAVFASTGAHMRPSAYSDIVGEVTLAKPSLLREPPPDRAATGRR